MLKLVNINKPTLSVHSAGMQKNVGASEDEMGSVILCETVYKFPVYVCKIIKLV